MKNSRFAASIAASLAIIAMSSSASIAGSNNAGTGNFQTTCRFGSPQFIKEWNKHFSQVNCAVSTGVVSVVPKHGFAPHAANIPLNAQQSGDYYNEEVSQGAMRWTHMPLRVCVAASTPSYLAAFTQSLDEWTKASGGRISFVQVQSPSGADITADWVAGQPGAGEAGNTKMAFGSYGGERVPTHAHIDFATSIAGRPISDSEMKKTCLHELGHALGMTHTSGSGDIMYWQSNANQTCDLGPRDAATIRRLYGS